MKNKLPEIDFDVAAPIIAKFGGRAAMSRITNHPYGRIDGWAKSGTIPERYRYGLLVIAKREGIPHTAWDYIAYLADLPIAA